VGYGGAWPLRVTSARHSAPRTTLILGPRQLRGALKHEARGDSRGGGGFQKTPLPIVPNVDDALSKSHFSGVLNAMRLARLGCPSPILEDIKRRCWQKSVIMSRGRSPRMCPICRHGVDRADPRAIYCSRRCQETSWKRRLRSKQAKEKATHAAREALENFRAEFGVSAEAVAQHCRHDWLSKPSSPGEIVGGKLISIENFRTAREIAFKLTVLAKKPERSSK